MKVIAHQNLLDIAVQELGSIETVFELAMANGKSITSDLTAGEVLQLPKVADEEIANYFQSRERKIATEYYVDVDVGTSVGGISFWAINHDFIVS